MELRSTLSALSLGGPGRHFPRCYHLSLHVDALAGNLGASIIYRSASKFRRSLYYISAIDVVGHLLTRMVALQTTGQI